MSTSPKPIKVRTFTLDRTATPTEKEMCEALNKLLTFIMQRYPCVLAMNLQLVFDDPKKGMRHRSGTAAVEEWTRDTVLLMELFHKALLREARDPEDNAKASQEFEFSPWMDPADLVRDRKFDC